LATTGVVLPAPQASARPIDCSLTADLFNAGSAGMNARAMVYCTKPEHYSVYLYLEREDGWTNTPVAKGKGESKGKSGWIYAYANEPCSDLQTNKTYRARAVLYDTTYHYPIEVKDFKSRSYRGHC
jgi:hypothetical protein